MNIAVFGGSFDPPHIAHEIIVSKALQELDIDRFFVVPAFLNPFKSTTHITAIHRLELVKELFEDIKDVDIFDYEVKQNKPVPTIETIEYIKKTFENIEKIYLIIGADNLQNLTKWHQFDRLNSMVEFVVATRDNIKIDNFKTLNINYDISSTKIRENLDITLIPKKIQKKVNEFWNKE